MPDFARRLKQVRTDHKITQEELATALNVSQNAIYNWENGKREPSINTITRIADYFDVSVDYLMDTQKKTIGEQIRFLRKCYGFTRKQLGQWTYISETTIAKFENGEQEPTIEQLQRIASTFGGSVSDIFITNEEELEMFDWDSLYKTLRQSIWQIQEDNSFNSLHFGEAISTINIQENKLLSDFRALNAEGQTEAIKRVEELTELPKYTE